MSVHPSFPSFQVDELRQKLEEKNKMIEKKTHAALAATQDKNRISNELGDLRDQVDIKDRKVNVLQRKVTDARWRCCFLMESCFPEFYFSHLWISFSLRSRTSRTS